MIRKVILTNGKEVDLDEWQELYSLKPYKVSKSLDLTNDAVRFQNVYCEPLLIFIDKLSASMSHISITPVERKHTLNFDYCTTDGLFIDIECLGYFMKELFKKNIKLVRREIRKEYPEFDIRYKLPRAPFSSIYIDVAPMYYRWGRPFANRPHNDSWEISTNAVPKGFKPRYATNKNTVKSMCTPCYTEEY